VTHNILSTKTRKLNSALGEMQSNSLPNQQNKRRKGGERMNKKILMITTFLALAMLVTPIMAAPASLCLAGLFPVFREPPAIFIYILVPLALLSTLYVYTLIPKLIKVPFHPGLAPLTFPLAISTLAIQRYYKYLVNINLNLSNLVNQIFYIELFIATIVIGYIVYMVYKLSISGCSTNVSHKQRK